MLLCRYKLKDAVLEGGMPFIMAHEGISLFDYLEKDKNLAKLLSHAMEKSGATYMTVLQQYKGFDGVKEVVAVGGAHGATLSCILSMNPHLKGINFDLPHVIENAPSLPGIHFSLENIWFMGDLTNHGPSLYTRQFIRC